MAHNYSSQTRAKLIYMANGGRGAMGGDIVPIPGGGLAPVSGGALLRLPSGGALAHHGYTDGGGFFGDLWSGLKSAGSWVAKEVPGIIGNVAKTAQAVAPLAAMAV